jgi:hypothetical protein
MPVPRRQGHAVAGHGTKAAVSQGLRRGPRRLVAPGSGARARSFIATPGDGKRSTPGTAQRVMPHAPTTPTSAAGPTPENALGRRNSECRVAMRADA